MASALCQHCNVLLVEADTNSLTNLGSSVNEAVALGSAVVSNSYGGNEASGEVTEENDFYNHPGVAITASSGDNGFGVEFPAASQFVTAVGGTSLVHASNTRGWSETVWNGAGSGCSAFITKPAWQHDTGCGRRTVADVSADADPNTGVAVFDSTAFQGLSGWLEFGGTSVASPIIASVYALAGNASTVTYGSFPYSHAASLNDVTSGSNGTCGSYLCTGTTGYDGPTGLGTPNGTGAF
jgi:subtilase family serine protease